MYHPISSLPFLLETIEEVLKEANSLLQNLVISEFRSISIDQTAVGNGIKMYSDILQTIPLYQEQADNWKDYFLKKEDSEKLSQLEENIRLLKITCTEILNLLNGRMI